MSRITFIGTSDAFGAGGRRQAAIFVETASGGLLLDCAPTTNTGLAELGIARGAIDAIAISHVPADHFAGSPSFLLAAIYEDRRSHPLIVAGPPGVEARVRAAADAVGHALAGHAMPFSLRFVETPAEQRVDVGPATLRSFPVQHQPDSCPHGLHVESGGRRIVYSGDTGWFDGLTNHTRGADLLICECTFHEPVISTLRAAASRECPCPPCSARICLRTPATSRRLCRTRRRTSPATSARTPCGSARRRLGATV
jgi:ribonuclease BN (tRNA processing enzyme)